MGIRACTIAVALLLSACGTSPTAVPSPLSSDVTPSPSPSSTITITQTSLRDTAKTFFDTYISCMSDPPEEAAGRVGTYCQSHNAAATAALPAHLDAGGIAAAGADPITCGQNPPIDITVETATVTGVASGTVAVSAGYRPQPLSITIDVVTDAGALRVDDVHCPSA